ncbi:MAG: hypothetical protein B6240_02995 [Desulfobacteraceae bacterium 4572_87]|nr:MAG: hypothetical protein B6240_02995 [Desulfobacteraceae bacterium 4572_87]
MFFGRNVELRKLHDLSDKKTASLVVVKGRRRIGEQMKNIFDIPALPLENWSDAFSHLASHTRSGSVLILLDEISWMAGKSSDFAGKLKIAWDTKFKKNNRLILVLCGEYPWK